MTAIESCQSSSVTSWVWGPTRLMPALLTTMSSRPRSATTAGEGRIDLRADRHVRRIGAGLRRRSVRAPRLRPRPCQRRSRRPRSRRRPRRAPARSRGRGPFPLLSRSRLCPSSTPIRSSFHAVPAQGQAASISRPECVRNRPTGASVRQRSRRRRGRRTAPAPGRARAAAVPRSDGRVRGSSRATNAPPSAASESPE